MNRFLRAIILLFIVLLVFPEHLLAAPSDPVIVAIDAAIESLKREPNQFNLSVTSVGVMGSASGGGIGIQSSPQGGGPGSTTIGVQGTANTGNIQITQAAANEQLIKEAERAIRLLQEIRDALSTQKIDAPSVKSRLQEFAGTYAAPALKAVIEALVKKKLGL